MFNKNLIVSVLAIALVFGFTPSIPAHAATLPELGAAESFSVLAALSMSAAGAGTTVYGDLGLSPGLETSRTGSWNVVGTEYFGPGTLAETAQADALGAFNNLVGQDSDGGWGVSPWSPVPGVWTDASSPVFTGTITLDGDYDDVWVFQVGQDMTFSGSVILTGDAQACHVFWQIGRDATIAASSTFVGTLIASRDITLVSGATVDGRIISLNSSLTTDGNTISGPTCTAAPTTTTTTTTTTAPPTTTTTPAPIESYIHYIPAQFAPTTTTTKTVPPSSTTTTVSPPTTTITSVPKLPNTGFPPSENNIPWNIIVPAGIFAILTFFYFARREQTI